MFGKILIANRGEIACRIIKTARRLGIRTVAVYSEADRNARHVRLADEAVLIGPAPVRDSYLRAERIIGAARETGAEAIHPGYGFLSENAEFAAACLEAGVVFIGPPVAAIEAMGSKSAAKALMGKANVPLTPGYHGEHQQPDLLAAKAEAIGYPVLIKASAGGGGKGMRRVDRAEDFDAALASCKREAASAFGDDHVLIEKYVLSPRHIEIQVFADRHGNCLHLFERDCSVQRRHQKVLEEAPAPHMTPDQRAAMGKAAVEAARAVGYVGAGTVEFIVEPSGQFYFMEMNTRLQVEHPVTEMITGVDLVEWQLRIASGESLPLRQDQLAIRGHAIEARIYAEDPDNGFLPSIGRLLHLAPPPQSAQVRVDTGVEQCDEISQYYDPMIAKLIVWGENRAQALARMQTALSSYQIVGVRNNIAFLSRLLATDSFVYANLDTGLIEREQAALLPPAAGVPADAVWAAAVITELLKSAAETTQISPWAGTDGWRLNAGSRREFLLASGEHTQQVQAVHSGAGWDLAIADRVLTARAALSANGALRVELAGRRFDCAVVAEGRNRHVFLAGNHHVLRLADPLEFDAVAEDSHGGLLSPMPGLIIALMVEPDVIVEKGATLLVMEAMKMEHMLVAPARGRVKAFHCDVGEQVVSDVELITFEAEPDQ